MKTKAILLMLLISSLSLATACGGSKNPSSATNDAGTATTAAASVTQDSADIEVTVDTVTEKSDSTETEDTNATKEEATLPAEETVEIELEDGEEIGFD